MKLLLSFSKQSGNHSKTKKIDFVIKELGKFFEVERFESKSKEEAFEKYQKTDAEAIVVLGGDGHFNNLLNAIMPLEKKPILGYLNFGTLGDVGRLFGLNGRLKHDLKIITDMAKKKYDVGEIVTKDERRYFMYVACVGAFSNIPYVSPRKRLGRLSYYLKAVPQVFKKTRLSYSLKTNESESLKRENVPFLMLLNGTHMAGFKINKEAVFDDGKFELYETKNGMFNGLLNYIPFKSQKHSKESAICIKFDKEFKWCLDGEEGPVGDANLLINKQSVTVFSAAN